VALDLVFCGALALGCEGIVDAAASGATAERSPGEPLLLGLGPTGEPPGALEPVQGRVEGAGGNPDAGYDFMTVELRVTVFEKAWRRRRVGAAIRIC
jgi:hypothetical protein